MSRCEKACTRDGLENIVREDTRLLPKMLNLSQTLFVDSEQYEHIINHQFGYGHRYDMCVAVAFLIISAFGR